MSDLKILLRGGQVCGKYHICRDLILFVREKSTELMPVI